MRQKTNSISQESPRAWSSNSSHGRDAREKKVQMMAQGGLIDLTRLVDDEIRLGRIALGLFDENKCYDGPPRERATSFSKFRDTWKGLGGLERMPRLNIKISLWVA